MKGREVRAHHGKIQPKWLRIREAITFCLGVTLACSIGIYIGHTAGKEAKQLKEQHIHYVQEGETLWDIASGIASDEEDIRQVIYEIQDVNNISGTDDLHPGQRLIIKF